jgi:hypothetical protein
LLIDFCFQKRRRSRPGCRRHCTLPLLKVLLFSIVLQQQVT